MNMAGEIASLKRPKDASSSRETSLSESVRSGNFVPLSNWIQHKPQDRALILSTFFHSMIHIVCNVANYVLYTELA